LLSAITVHNEVSVRNCRWLPFSDTEEPYEGSEGSNLGRLRTLRGPVSR
jgi:hypothetical protein